ncbi:MAG: Rrf2 family transcriptional regulator [Deltaproteobacteria bacterium]|nr:Rrf2 family transcriptional regulator [Deltaproteobacteria bacterium]MBW2053113.1 Rrf2 family transcriptional regulator [Deltaproteobacteria bacterium]MBW2141446.1 Rrf2 family transcriptional regulator [Deltaproteobacteria bacterium]MBW2323716.1 Rrf2 family transcriptional regulator [Deltaproteobacteria bacterium]
MKLSTKTRYGARLLFDLARHYGQGPVNIGDIAKRQDISVKYLEQIIRPLKKAKLVESVRGPKGGHILAKNPADISLGQIVRLLESGDELVECVEDPLKCERSSDCCVRKAWQEATIALYDKLNSTFLIDLLMYEEEFETKGDCTSLRKS